MRKQSFRRSSASVPIFYGDWPVLSALSNDIKKALDLYGTGTLLDVGCGAKPYEHLGSKISTWIGVDVPENDEAELHGVAYEIPTGDDSVDTILCTQVLEHLEEPGRALHEFFRVLRPGGHLILTAPQYWSLHEEPRDFYRYTSIGLEYLTSRAGFKRVELVSQGAGAMVAAQALNNSILCAGDTFTFAQTLAFKATKAPFYLVINIAGWLASRFLRTPRDVLNHLIVCAKPSVAAESGDLATTTIS